MNDKLKRILEADDAHHVMVTVWGEQVRVQDITAGERAHIEKEWTAKGRTSKDPMGFRIALLARTLKTDDGTQPLGTEDEIGKLAGKNARQVERLVEAALRVCAFDSSDVEELVKN